MPWSRSGRIGEGATDETTLSFRYEWRGWERGRFRTGRMALPATRTEDETTLSFRYGSAPLTLIFHLKLRAQRAWTHVQAYGGALGRDAFGTRRAKWGQAGPRPIAFRVSGADLRVLSNAQTFIGVRPTRGSLLVAGDKSWAAKKPLASRRGGRLSDPPVSCSGCSVAW